MTMIHAAQTLDLVAAALVFGATVWFFFIQSPVLLARMGREAFVPFQMRLTVVLFRTLTVALFVIAGATLLHSPLVSAAALSAAVALLGGLVNTYVVVPRALRAGGQTRKDIRGKDSEGSTASFASEGAGDGTKAMHRAVVLFVVVMLGGVIWHAVAVLAR